MGVPLNLGDIYSGFFSADAYNTNGTLIEEAVDKALDRTGSTDNAMKVDLDLGLNNIFNLKSAILSHQAVPLQQVIDIITASGEEVTSLVTMEDRFTAVGGEEVISFTAITYTPTTNSLMVFKNGEYQRAQFEYLETGSTEITLTAPLTAGDVVDVFGSRYDAQQYVDLAITAATVAQQAEVNALQSASDAQDSADIAAAAAGYKLDVNNQTGITYTLQPADEGDFIRMNNTAANTVIVPADSLVDFELGTIVLVRQIDTGKTTIQQGLGVTINAPYNSYEISQADFGIALVKIAPDTWDMVKSFGGVDSSDLVAFTQEFDARLQEIQVEILSSDPTFVVNFDSLLNRVDTAIASIQDEFDLLETNVTNTSDDLNTNFGLLFSRFNIIEPQFIALQNDFDIIQPAFTQIQIDFGNLEGRFDTIESQWVGIDNRMDDIELALQSGAVNVSDFESQLGDKGYQKFPGGMIMQWGREYLSGMSNSSSKNFSFPITFPNRCYTVTFGETWGVISGGTYDEGSYVSSIRTDGFTYTSAWKYGMTQHINWIAIGS